MQKSQEPLAVHTLHIDIETYSEVDLFSAGAHKYVASSSFMILLLGYSWDHGPVCVLDLAQGESIPEWLLAALADPQVRKFAYNASFELLCLNKFYRSPWEQWSCTMVQSLYCGYPAGLAATAEALGLGAEKKKMQTGNALIRTFCVPQKDGTRKLPEQDPEKWAEFKAYCGQDVAAEMEISRCLSSFPLPDSEQEIWLLDQAVNNLGIAVDEEFIQGAVACEEIVMERLLQEAREISKVENPRSIQQLTAWLETQIQQKVPNLTQTTVKHLLQTGQPPEVQRILEIRQELAKTSIKKYEAMQAAVGTDGRIRGLLQFYGANRTGRWAGRLVQVQNLPRNYLEPLATYRDWVKKGDLPSLQSAEIRVPDILSQLIRTAFIPSPGKKMLVADFSSIEARIIAWLAQEEWRLAVFTTHGKIYEASAAAMFDVPLESIQKGKPEYALREKGKIAELALGYQGSVGALRNMGALELGLSNRELSEITQRWREANPKIVALWAAYEEAAQQTVKNGVTVSVGPVHFTRTEDPDKQLVFLSIQLPSGRSLFYVQPQMQMNRFKQEAVHYQGVNQTTKKWELIPTYGGKLVENVVQALARDCLATALLRVHRAGFPVLMHIHDEIVAEGPAEDLPGICELMEEPLPWAPGLPLKAEGFSSEFYKKA